MGVPPVVVSGPTNGIVGHSYSSRFTITGAPPPTVTLVSGDVPPGLTLGIDGTLAGTPTQAGSYTFTARADNHLNFVDAAATIAISSVTLGTPAPVSGGRRVRATICTSPTGHKHKPACSVRTLIGTFPPPRATAAATLMRGRVTYAVGTATAGDRELKLRRRRPLPAGSYTLILHRAHHETLVPVTVR